MSSSRPLPPQTNSAHSSSHSPLSMSTDLGLDPSDPLNLLLNNSQNDNTQDSDAGSPPDWSQLSHLWPSHLETEDFTMGAKQYPDLMDFSDLASLPMDMDFNPAMSIEPSALHFDSNKFTSGYPFEEAFTPSDFTTSQFPFTFQSPNLSNGDFSSTSSVSTHTESVRRLSVTSSCSSSGASLSPVIGNSPGPARATSTTPLTSDPLPSDPAAELAQRVRESAGVMLAVPINSHMQGQGFAPSQQIAFPGTSQTNSPSSAKLPIPRLPRHSSGSMSKAGSPISSSASSASSTPPPTTPPPPSNAPSPSPSSGDSSTATPPPSGMASSPISGQQPRPKTSHTTIERRYRTNLNARIQSLRMAVPALRVLEDREAIANVGAGGKKVKVRASANAVIRGIKSECITPGANVGDGEVVDVIDERGFVDGVRVARKCSKANVLGKAVEYIRVLKKRETRLKAEQSGLKSLISGLVGGPALLREWEHEWRERFGGEEKDEVEGDEGDDDSDDEDDDDDESAGKKRKRAKVSPTKKEASKEKENVAGKASKVGQQQQVTVPPPLGADGQPEKRKRGRPRKIVVPPPMPVRASVAAPVTSQSSTQFVQYQDHQMSSFVQPQEHQGTQPQQYFLAVFALFSFFNSPLTSNYSGSGHGQHTHTGTVLSLHPPLSPNLVLPPPPQLHAIVGLTWRDYAQYFHLVVSVVVFFSVLGSWAGLDVLRVTVPGVRAVRKRIGSVFGSKGLVGGGSIGSDYEEFVKVAREWVGGQARPTDGAGVGLWAQMRVYRCISTARSASAGDLGLVAMGAWGWGVMGRARARWMWERAIGKADEQGSMKAGGKAYERVLVKDVGVSEAVELFRGMDLAGRKEVDPIREVAGVLVQRRMKRHLKALFARTVLATTSDNVEGLEKDQVEAEEAVVKMTVEASRELGGRLGELGQALEWMRVYASKPTATLSSGAFQRVFNRIMVLRKEQHALSNDREGMEGETIESEIVSLLVALVLYRRVFASTLDAQSTPTGMSFPLSVLLSPPVGPTATTVSKRKTLDGRLVLELRRVLGSRVFEEGEGEGEGVDRRGVIGVEDAKDKVVDLIVEFERRERRW